MTKSYADSIDAYLQFDGEVIEPIPLSAEELLRTSFKFADNTVMTGGKESRVYGIEVNSGRIKYECTMDGCFGPAGETLSPKEDDLEDIIIVSNYSWLILIPSNKDIKMQKIFLNNICNTDSTLLTLF